MNWREIFKRYVNIVASTEGVTFLYEMDWTPEQWAVITEARREVDEEWERLHCGHRVKREREREQQVGTDPG